MSIAASLDFSARLRKAAPVVGAELAALQGVASISGLPPTLLAALAAGASVRRLTRRGVLAAEGSIPPSVFVIVAGRVRSVRRSDSGREVTLETFGVGDLLADAVVAPERPLSNDWEATESTEVLVISREVFVAQMEAVPGLALTLTGQMLSRLERSKQLAAGLALADVPGRVTAALRALADAQGQPEADGVVVQNRPTQQELANSIGACRETVSRVVSDLARRGLITPRGRALVISRRLLDAGE
jgi:CRP/FNR family transcriptional regulator, cyclic AMP receptor protein